MTQVTAELASNTKKSGSQYIYLLYAGPQITSVTPSPLAAGTITLTIRGSGFQAGATVMDGSVQMSTISVTSDVIKAATCQSPATSATFMVRNPSSVYGNAITVPIGSGSSGGHGKYGIHRKHRFDGVNRRHRHHRARHIAVIRQRPANPDPTIYGDRCDNLDGRSGYGNFGWFIHRAVGDALIGNGYCHGEQFGRLFGCFGYAADQRGASDFAIVRERYAD